MKNDLILSKICKYARKILKYCRNITYTEFYQNELIIDACIFNLSQIGELAGRLDEDYQKQNSQIAWKQMYGLRNRIVHDYEGVNVKLIWEIILR